jgi:hypothetical protein
VNIIGTFFKKMFHDARTDENKIDIGNPATVNTGSFRKRQVPLRD